MVVFSDLDRSIIYSKRFLGEDKSELEIEIYKNENISYISKKTVELIKQIKEKIEFIPTTTRTIEQFKRIEFSKYDIDFKYAITSNGGNILVDGEIDREYKSFINQKLKNSLHIDEVIKLLEEYKNIKGIKKIRNNYNNYYNVDIYITPDKVISLTGFMDSGNNLVDPYKKRPIILVNKKLIDFDYNLKTTLLVPYHSLNSSGLLKCIIPEKMYISEVGVRRGFLIGISEDDIRIDGVDCILHHSLL